MSAEKGQSSNHIFTNETLEILNPSAQKNFIDNVLSRQIEGGFMGKFLGTKMPNMSVYSAFLFCLALLVFVIIDMCFLVCSGKSCLNMDLMKMIIPVFTMSLGYMFGKNDTRDS